MPSASKIIIAVLLLLFIGLSMLILEPFFKTILWALIIATITSPIYLCWRRIGFFQRHNNLSAFSFTLLIIVCLLLPLVAIVVTLSTEIINGIIWLQKVDLKSIHLPVWLQNLPLVGNKLALLWSTYIQNPEHLIDLLKKAKLGDWYTAATTGVGYVVSKAETLVFLIVSLFFILRDGPTLVKMIEQLTKKLNSFWQTLTEKLYKQLLGISQAFFYVGIGTGVIMTVVYYSLGLPFPFLLGSITAVCSIVPFLLPIFYVLLTGFLFLQGQTVDAIILFAIGMVLNQIVDNWLQPYLIGKNAHIHFLVILFGIIGGVKAFGFIGIFLGPIILNLAVAIVDDYLDYQIEG